jgi:hypothetical protein
MSERTGDQSSTSGGQAHDGTAKAVNHTGAPVLSEDEKARIRHEMLLREEIHRELAKGKSPERRFGVHPFLNSPFFLTAVCGLFASVISHVYARTSAHNEHQLALENAHHERVSALENALRERKIALLSSVANDVPTCEFRTIVNAKIGPS